MSGEGRRWLELRVRCRSADDREGLLADALVAMGARGVVEHAGWFVSYFPEPPDVDAFLDDARGRLRGDSGLEDLQVEHEWQEHEEWAETWKRGFQPRRIGEHLVVHPSWSEPEDVGAADVVIVLDPGMAFGTAEHATTRGSLRLLERAVRPGDRVLDLGAGSGILAIAAVKLGAREAVAIEGDPLACEALAENVARNSVSSRVRVREGWATASTVAAEGPFDGIVSNIETGILEPLFEGFARALESGAWLVISGVLDHEWNETRQTLSVAGFDFTVVDADGEWRSGLFERRR